MSSEDATHSPTIKAAFALLVALNIVLMWLVAAPMLSRRHAGGMRVWGLGDPQIIAKSIPGAAQQDDQHSNVCTFDVRVHGRVDAEQRRAGRHVVLADAVAMLQCFP